MNISTEQSNQTIFYDPITQQNIKGWVGYTFDVVIILNSLIISLFALWGMKTWRRMPVVQYTVVPILLVSIITVIGEIIHRFGARNIAPLFIFQAMTQHAVISSMQAVNTMPLRNNACSLALGDGDLGLLWWIYTPFHLGYITCYIIAYIPSIGAFCRYN